MLISRTLERDEFSNIVEFYRRNGYDSPISPDDHFLVIENENEIMGALRVCVEEGVLILRGMRVADSFQRQGIGSKLLNFFHDFMGSKDCYCIAHSHLGDFYKQAGFEDIDPDRAPDFLKARLALYQTKLGLDVLLLYMPSPGIQAAG